ncbi:MAG: hypothetical protein PHQ27_07625 [Victivallales bacterium]|nr:hypothetical protein [Victivallales bacterium]
MTEAKKRHRPSRRLWPLVAALICGGVALNSTWRELGRSVITLLQILFEVGLACFIGSILEYRSWLRFISFLAAPLTRYGRLPAGCAAAFVTAVVSGNAAAMMLAEQRRAATLSRREMIFGALCLNAPAMISFSLTMMFPVVGTIGIAGAIYYGITYAISLAMLLLFLLAARISAPQAATTTTAAATAVPTTLPCYDWPTALRKAGRRTMVLLGRVMLITAPLYLLTAFALQRGFFRLGSHPLPSGWERWLTPETGTILAARLGGMLSAAGITAELLRQHQVTVIQVVFVFILGNIVNNPLRTLRRSLPVALGIYPGYDGALIVGIQSGLRLLLNIVAAAAIVIFFG